MKVNTEVSAPLDALAGFNPLERTSYKERIALRLERIVFYGLLVTVVLTAIPYGTVEPWWEAAFVCVVFAFMAVRIVHALITGEAQIKGYGLLLPLLCLCAFSILQTLPLVPRELSSSVAAWSTISADPHETRKFVFKLLSLIIAGELLLRFTSSRSRFTLLVHIVIGVGVASALFGLVRQFTQGESSFILTGLTAGAGYGQFINANHFAFLMEMTLGLLAGLITGGGIDQRRRPAYWAMALLVWMALVFTNSRGGVISMLSLVLFIAFVTANNNVGRIFNHQRRKRLGKLVPYAGRLLSSVAVAALLGLVVTVAVVWVGGDAIVRRMETVSREVSVDTTDRIRRIEIWKATWQLAKDHPFVGVGFGGYWTVIPEYFRATGEWSLQQAHNDYLEILASGGLIGAVLVAWFLGSVVYSASKSRGSNDSFYRASRLGTIAGLFAVAVHSFVDFGLHITINGLVFVILIVIVTTSGSGESNKLQKQRGRLCFGVGILALLAAFGGILINARAGYSSWLAARVVTDQAGISSLDRAIRLDPSNARPYDVRARSLLNAGKLAEAIRDFEVAVSLRPRDYLLWLELGYSRAKLGDLDGARAAYAVSVRLAPHYARPHWYMGMLLINMRLRDEAFAEFRSAVTAQEDYLPYVVNTAWREFDGDAGAVQRAVQPQNPAARLALARFFLHHGKTAEAVSLFRTAGEDSSAERQELVADLLEGKQFVSAYELWSGINEGHNDVNRPVIPNMVDGDFEHDVNIDSSAFGWQLAQRLEGVSANRDPKEPNTGAFSLRLDFNGISNPSTKLVSQLILAEPQVRYRLSFAGRTQNLVTGGLPVIIVTDAGDGRVLARSEAMSGGSRNWQNYSVELSTGDNTKAVIISLQRKACSSSPCPAFGHVWIDSFLYHRL